MTKIFALNPDQKIFKDYDFSKVDKTEKCDAISRKCGYAIIATKIIAVALIITSVASVYFCFLGAASFFAPLGIFDAGTSAIALLGTLSTTVFSAIPAHFFLKAGLGILTETKDHCNEVNKLAQQRKVELLKV